MFINLSLHLRALLLGFLSMMAFVAESRALNSVLNLTNQTIDTYTQTVTNNAVGGAFSNNPNVWFRRSISTDPVGSSGSGVYRDLYRVQLSGQTSSTVSEDGFNRNTSNAGDEFDESIPNGFNPYLRVSELVTDSSGGYYVFALDVNENSGSSNELISLDTVRVYTSSSNITDGTTINTVPELSGLGTLRYDMNAGSTSDDWNYVFLDYSLGAGSGKMDMYLFIPTSYFAAAASTDYVYLYSAFGRYPHLGSGRTAGLDTSDGGEQWSIPANAGNVQVLVPEPTTAALLLLGGTCCFVRRKRPQTLTSIS